MTASATETLPQKRNSFEAAVDQARADSARAFSLDTSEGSEAKEVRYA